MPCFLLLVILLFPRIALALMWFFSTYLQRAFHGGLLLPVLGFIFLPLTTIVYAWELNSGMPTAGINLLWLLWIFSTSLQRAFQGGRVLPVLGFIFLPLTTIVYAGELNSGMPTAGK